MDPTSSLAVPGDAGTLRRVVLDAGSGSEAPGWDRIIEARLP